MKNYRVVKAKVNTNVLLPNGEAFTSATEVVSSFDAESDDKAAAEFVATVRNTELNPGELLRLVVDKEVDGCVRSELMMTTPIA